MYRVLGLIIGYFLGCINFAYIIGRFKEHIDIREYGSGNSGTTNAIRVMGWRLGMLTFLGDFLKSLVAYFVVAAIFDNVVYGLYAGFGAILGHNWPVFLRFKGGKGIASTIGLIYAVDWRLGLLVSIEMFLVIYITKYVSLGSIIMAIIMPVGFFLFHSELPEFTYVGLVLMVMALVRHKANIQRLLRGKENKIGTKKV
ncbi:MAG: glycerol-3-phosphate 1-O-acyltransferase PlsY [Vallitaleaceae bacterium]|nr:glycerol-3-phosphate 1-O-acyltransferase PlsY [Vallitaleaceae bacterium]